MIVGVHTSARSKSLQKVAEHILNTLKANGINAEITYGIGLADYVAKNYDKGIIVMPFDMAIASNYFYLHYRYIAEHKKSIFYTTIEGDVLDPSTLLWANKYIEPVANSMYTKRKIEKAGFKVTDVVYHGVDTRLYKPDPEKKADARRALNASDDNFILLYVAMSHPRKCHNLARSVMEILGSRDQSIKLIVFTDDKGAENYMGLNNVVAIKGFGEFSEVDMTYLYNAADMYVQFSCSEGFGMPVLEAHACGKPVVHPSYDPLNEISSVKASFRVPVVDVKRYKGVEGILFEMNIYDPVEFADAIIQAKDLVIRNRDEYTAVAREHALKYDYREVYRYFVNELNK